MLKILRHITQEVNAAPNLEEALTLVVKRLCEVLPADACSIFICDDTYGEYVLIATQGLNIRQVGKVRLKFGEGLTGLIGEREEPINLADASLHPDFKRHPELHEERYHGFLGIPIIEQGELLGVLIVQKWESYPFAEEEEALCVTIAIHLASEMAHARAKGELEKLEAQQKKRRKKTTEAVLFGIPSSSGVAIGTAIIIYPQADLDAVPDQEIEDIKTEISDFKTALSSARDEIYRLQIRAKSSLSVGEHILFDAYLRLLDSRTFMNEVIAHIKEGQWAQGSLKRVIKRYVLHFESLEDPYLRERATDFRDLGRRVLSHLQFKKKEALEYPKNTILVSDEVTPTSLMEIPCDHLKGVISGTGSSNSHVAILARALGLPAVMGVHGPLFKLSLQELIVDGYNGQIYLSPSSVIKKEFKTLVHEEQQLDEELKSLRDLPAKTTDGHALALYVNTGLAIDGGFSLNVGSEGVGLYRTEMPFMIHDRFPSEEEQRITYRQLLNTFAPRPVIMRMLDIGGDKTLSYFSVEEDNPFLGWRGIRFTLDHPEIFLQQIRAMLHASEGLNNLSVLLPMITSVHEVETAICMINQAYEELVEEDVKVQFPEIGLMIEVPATVYQAYNLAKRVDFLSVGSNDLIQYLLAVDRNNPRVANLYDCLHPAVLQALKVVVTAGHKAGKSVSICGEMAGDPVSVVLLLAMGFDMLSMSARILPHIKWIVRSFSLKTARELLEEVLKMDDPKDIRLHMENALEKAGLGSLIRAGR
ncbi:phosphoenolpyruvate--protein phosphotransferase [Coxiella endosymbiont of Amblyomma americanum]|uniref:phosphoenolpyruvate--protein phosphotransferase n=1 Tax=Coxiella endosymbiont of Amblyomma americanum TaxID=325775 RepID=UPI00057F271A|nr:phosphoenolpyruvate--protein phosphotransferase [Coxiella endosymbiont of Amblyomma americanum]AJC50238.1 phosphoenolpyruvate-protein phosphotransferase [Coxiella endosymbiont of Amblyomma americanum]AUJ59014.1 phosphoenolpyruvate--protein phosphotransferase [Coxiella-like endosymbiont of Amblyomma americanum]